MLINSEVILRSLIAAVALYVAYFSVGVIAEVLVYATAGLRDSLPALIPWKAIIDAIQILIAVGLMRFFLKSYDAIALLLLFSVFLAVTLATIYHSPEMAGVSKSGAIAQFLTAIFICTFLLWKKRL